MGAACTRAGRPLDSPAMPAKASPDRRANRADRNTRDVTLGPVTRVLQFTRSRGGHPDSARVAA